MLLIRELYLLLISSGSLTVIFASIVDSSSYICPDNWVYDEHDSCFYFGLENFTWIEAADFCDELDGFLAEVIDEEQAKFLTSIAVLMETVTGVNTWWLGLTDFSHEGRWMWANSATDASFTQWDVDCPDLTPHNHNDCVSMTSKGQFTWRDRQCYEGELAAPMCQRKSNEMTTATDTTTTHIATSSSISTTATTTSTTITTATTTATSTSTTATIIDPEECKGNYTILDEEWRRIHYNPGGADECNEQCDMYLPSGWYRFMGPAGSRIPITPPEMFNRDCDVCQTDAASWVQEGKYPALGESAMDVTFCFAFGAFECYYGNTFGKAVACQEDDGNLFYLYYLNPVPTCSFAYCAL